MSVDRKPKLDEDGTLYTNEQLRPDQDDSQLATEE